MPALHAAGAADATRESVRGDQHPVLAAAECRPPVHRGRPAGLVGLKLSDCLRMVYLASSSPPHPPVRAFTPMVLVLNDPPRLMTSTRPTLNLLLLLPSYCHYSSASTVVARASTFNQGSRASSSPRGWTPCAATESASRPLSSRVSVRRYPKP